MAITRDELQSAIDELPRAELCHLPTPLEFLPRFTAALGGPRIYVKRDDCTGLALGGNKARHNEFIFGDALQKGADVFVWGAGVQSNNCRQTAAACAKLGLDCHLILGRGKPANGPDVVQGNLLLDHLLGAKIDIVDEGLGLELDRKIAAQAAKYREAGRTPYYWEPDVVKPLAAIAYAESLSEMLGQAEAQEFVPVAVYDSSAGSTGAGVALGAKLLGYPGKVLSIAPLEWPWDTRADLARIANLAGKLLKFPVELLPTDIQIDFSYIPPGYGKLSEGCMEAMLLLARTEGLLLDPVYTGKALAGLIDHVRQGRYQPDDAIVFMHTGGTPALFAYADELAAAMASQPTA